MPSNTHATRSSYAAAVRRYPGARASQPSLREAHAHERVGGRPRCRQSPPGSPVEAWCDSPGAASEERVPAGPRRTSTQAGASGKVEVAQ